VPDGTKKSVDEAEERHHALVHARVLLALEKVLVRAPVVADDVADAWSLFAADDLHAAGK